MSTKNSTDRIIHTLSIDVKASNKQIAKDFGRFVRELVRQQRGGDDGFRYESMETLAECLQDEMDNVTQELAQICMHVGNADHPSHAMTGPVFKRGAKALQHFWNNTQLKGFTEHVISKNKAVVITNDKMLQKTLGKPRAKLA